MNFVSAPVEADPHYRICNRCVMDTTDTEITFNAKGHCSHCVKVLEDENSRGLWVREGGEKRLREAVEAVKRRGRGRPYDAIMGLSGGVDSSYVAYQARELGLRVLAVHVDAGWNSELAVKNIENIVTRCHFDLHTEVIDWEEMRDLQTAFLKAGVANQDTPQDHVFLASLYRTAIKNKTLTLLSGHNYATESILPASWGHRCTDLRQLRSIHRAFGEKKLKTYPTLSSFRYLFYYPYIRGIRTWNLLNDIPYNKSRAVAILERELGWRDYGGKHHESRFTKFFQAYYLPARFGYDKRRAHLSSLVVSGQMTRADALEALKAPAYPPEKIEEDKAFVLKKLRLSAEAFEALLRAPLKSYRDYPNDDARVNLMQFARSILVKWGAL